MSRTPGRTREINFFRVNDQFILADLPGYGYARVSKTRKAEWRPLIEGYLTKTPQLAGVVQLLDMRHEPSDDDVAMLDLLSELEMPTVVVLTKSDKLSKKASAERIRHISLGLGLDPEQTISFSAMTGEGRDELAGAIAAALASARDAQ